LPTTTTLERSPREPGKSLPLTEGRTGPYSNDGARDFQTVRAPFYSLDPSAYPLQGGFVVAVHMNGPINFEKKEFQLHGAKPNTEFLIYRMFDQPLLFHGVGPGVVAPAMAPIPAGFSIQTDKNGNGHIITPLATAAPVLAAIKGTVSVGIKNLLYDGTTLAYEADRYETFFDRKW
jgi:hypothetical protein